MTIEHTLLGVYMISVGSGVFTGLLICFISFFFKSRRSGAYGKLGIK